MCVPKDELATSPVAESQMKQMHMCSLQLRSALHAQHYDADAWSRRLSTSKVATSKKPITFAMTMTQSPWAAP